MEKASIALELLRDELANSSDWRAERARLYPHDGRNAAAADRLARLHLEVAALLSSGTAGGDATVRRFEELHDRAADLEVHGAVEEMHAFIGRIGFDHDPRTATQLLSALVDLFHRHIDTQRAA